MAQVSSQPVRKKREEKRKKEEKSKHQKTSSLIVDVGHLAACSLGEQHSLETIRYQGFTRLGLSYHGALVQLQFFLRIHNLIPPQSEPNQAALGTFDPVPVWTWPFGHRIRRRLLIPLLLIKHGASIRSTRRSGGSAYWGVA